MWINNQEYGKNFIYFYFQKFKAINNDRESKLFEKPFDVNPENKIVWAGSGKSKQLAPEVLTRWSVSE
jgi:hypothetical protein